MEKEVIVGEKTYKIEELKYKDVASAGDVPKEEIAKKMIVLSTGMSDEEYDNLSMKEGLALQKVINDFNGFEDFQNPPK